MRLVTWNLGMRTPRCADYLRQLEADVVVLQEADPSHANLAFADDGVQERWATAPSGKSFGVRVRAGIELADPDVVRLPWCIPVSVESSEMSFTLIAMWALTFKPQNPSYTRQLADVVQTYAGDSTLRPLVIAGDMNASAQQGTYRGHLANIVNLRSCGLESAYHWRHRHSDDADVETTLRWSSNAAARYHCDLFFIPPEWRTDSTRVTLGDPEVVFQGGVSDHLPVIVDVEGMRQQPVLARPHR